MSRSVIDLFDSYISEVRCVDIGAMINEPDEAVGHGQRMATFFQHPKVTVIGFEPQQDKCDDLNARHPNRKYLPHAVGDGATRNFHTTKTGLSSSFFPVDRSITDALNFPASAFEVSDTSELATTRLDDVPDALECDFLKLDAECAEVMIIENARAVLANCTVAQVEVNFLPYREDAPVFRDVDKAISESGFLLHNLGLMGTNFAPWGVTGNSEKYISQLFAGDVIYTKDFRSFCDIPTDKLFRASAILTDIYLSYDLCGLILRIIDQREGLATEAMYGEWFNSRP
mgnify:CR=1 FL=1